MKYPDVSKVLRGDTLLREDETWKKLIHEKDHLAESIENVEFESILEIGCGTGLYAEILRNRFPAVKYVGLDSNPEALAIAQSRNPNTFFSLCDFRDLPTGDVFDLVTAHAFLKHFCIEEWPALFLKFLSLGKKAHFDMQTAAVTLNDGSETFGNNLWVSESIFKDLLSKAGHTVCSSEIAYQKDDRRATIYLTERD